MAEFQEEDGQEAVMARKQVYSAQPAKRRLDSGRSGSNQRGSGSRAGSVHSGSEHRVELNEDMRQCFAGGFLNENGGEDH